MCIYTKMKTGSVLVPLKNVSWNNQLSDIFCSNNEPDCYSYLHSMHYYSLNPVFDLWFKENNGGYALFWSDVSSSWFLEIYDIAISVLFKLTFDV